MDLHSHKVSPVEFDAIKTHQMTTDVQPGNSNFKKGDIINVKEFDGNFTGRELAVKVTHVLKNPSFLQGASLAGLCLLSIKLV